MKCDELIQFNIRYEENGKLHFATLYKKKQVDEAIEELKQKLEDAKATAYAESVDAGMRERRLKRALWLERAERAKAIKWHEGLERYLQARKKWWPSRFSFMRDDEMYHVWYKCWCEVERKCRAKAEEYK